MKAIIEELGDLVLGCFASGLVVALFLGFLAENGAIRTAVLQFAATLC